MEHEHDPECLAKSYFDEPRWPLHSVLGWIALRRVAVMTRPYEEISRSRIRLWHKGYREAHPDEWISENAPYELKRALRSNKIRAIGPDDAMMAAEAWDRFGFDWRSWPAARFNKADVLSLWPARGKAANGEGKPGRPSIMEAIRQKLAERIGANEKAGTIGAEAQWLKKWAESEFPGDTRVPTSSDSIENQIRADYRKSLIQSPTKLSDK